jgi:hypothetical protein
MSARLGDDAVSASDTQSGHGGDLRITPYSNGFKNISGLSKDEHRPCDDDADRQRGETHAARSIKSSIFR